MKHYKLKELEIGMRVSINELSSIVGTPIYLIDMEHIDGEDYGTIVCIGDKGKTEYIDNGAYRIINYYDPDLVDVDENEIFERRFKSNVNN